MGCPPNSPTRWQWCWAKAGRRVDDWGRRRERWGRERGRRYWVRRVSVFRDQRSTWETCPEFPVPRQRRPRSSTFDGMIVVLVSRAQFHHHWGRSCGDDLVLIAIVMVTAYGNDGDSSNLVTYVPYFWLSALHCVPYPAKLALRCDTYHMLSRGLHPRMPYTYQCGLFRTSPTKICRQILMLNIMLRVYSNFEFFADVPDAWKRLSNQRTFLCAKTMRESMCLSEFSFVILYVEYQACRYVTRQLFNDLQDRCAEYPAKR